MHTVNATGTDGRSGPNTRQAQARKTTECNKDTRLYCLADCSIWWLHDYLPSRALSCLFVDQAESSPLRMHLLALRELLELDPDLDPRLGFGNAAWPINKTEPNQPGKPGRPQFLGVRKVGSHMETKCRYSKRGGKVDSSEQATPLASRSPKKHKFTHCFFTAFLVDTNGPAEPTCGVLTVFLFRWFGKFLEPF